MLSNNRENRAARPRWILWVRLIFRLVLAACFLGLLVGGTAFIYAYQKYARDLPDVSILETYRPSETTQILASNGTVITTLYAENRVWASLDDMSPWVVTALVSTEDSRFFEHHGVDPVGIARVLVNLLITRQAREGASTLTMQLARGIFPLNQDGDRVRKIKEMFLSLEIERRYDKKKILELYLNQVYFGAGAYGIHSAAQVYFNKGPKDLSLSEAALIAGLIQAPSRFNPLEHSDRAFVRQGEVLQRMKATGAITEAQLEEAIAERAQMKFTAQKARTSQIDRFPYFTNYVISELSARYDEEDLYRGGLTVITTLDPELQSYAQETLTREVNADGYELDVDSGAVVILENGTGYIKALVGGLGWSTSNQFNRAIQARRQPGSSFKPATYGAALEAGFTPESRVNDSPVSFPDGNGQTWSPKNSDGKFLGLITMRQALQGSRNVPAVKILDAVGVDKVISLAYQMGIRAKIPPNLSIALGAIEATPLEMAEFYSVIINGGNRVFPTAIKTIKDSSGKIIEDNRSSPSRRVLSAQTANSLISMLSDVVRAGTGTNAQVADWPIAGKTGTTDSSVDAWFCGFSPYYTCTVWIGNDDNHPMYNSYGGDLPATIFRLIMTHALKGKTPKKFPVYTATGSAPDILKQGDSVSPTPEESPTQTPTPAEEESPADLEDEPTATPSSDSIEDGHSYILPNTLDPNLPASSVPDVRPIDGGERVNHASDSKPEAPFVVTPAPLPESFSPQGGTSSEDKQAGGKSRSGAPVPQEVVLPDSGG